MAPSTASSLATAALQAPVNLLAQDNSGVLPRSFLIALLLMAPVALWQWRRIRARRRAEIPDVPPEPTPDAELAGRGPTLEAVVADIGRLGHGLRPGETAEVRIEPGLTVAGNPAGRAMVDQLVRDALERSCLETVGSTDLDGDLVLECRKR